MNMRLYELFEEQEELDELRGGRLGRTIAAGGMAAGMAMSPGVSKAEPSQNYSSPQEISHSVLASSPAKEFERFITSKFNWDALPFFAPAKKIVLQQLVKEYLGLLKGSLEDAQKMLSQVEDYFEPGDLQRLEQMFVKHQRSV